jgi:hypothetical protein
MAQKLRTLAANLRAAELSVATSVARLRNEGERTAIDALDAHCADLRRMASEVEQHARTITAIDMVVADRLNNFLMAILTASERLRDQGVADIREQLRITVDHGRAAVAHIRKSLADM